MTDWITCNDCQEIEGSIVVCDTHAKPKLKYPEHKNNNEFGDELFVVQICTNCVASDTGFVADHDQDGEYDVCPEWDGWEFSFTYPEDDRNGYGEPLHGFSKSACDGCHTSLHGERYDIIATFVDRSTQQSESVIHSASQPDTVNR